MIAIAAALFVLYVIKQATGSNPVAYFTIKDVTATPADGSGARIPCPPELIPNAERTLKNLNIIQGELYKINPAYKIKIHSTYRTPARNAQIGGATKSLHLKAAAVDFSVNGMQPEALHKYIYKLMQAGKIEKGGIGQGATYCHYDYRGEAKTWRYGSGNRAYSVPLSTLQ